MSQTGESRRQRHGVDVLELYRWAVQDPETHVAVLQQMYSRIRNGLRPIVFREDFSGTSAEAVAWVAADPARSAFAIDLDADTLKWARRRAARLLGSDADRVRFFSGDVLEVAPPQVPPADVISALNFSLLYFHERTALETYFRHALRCLDESGIVVCNVFGGAGTMRANVDERKVEPAARNPREQTPPPFGYRWEQSQLDAVTGRVECCIHFDVEPTQSSPVVTVERAFSYDWRLWTLPELTEVVRSAGFSDVQIWRHTYDPSKGRDGVFLGPVTSIKNEETWVAYVIAVR